MKIALQINVTVVIFLLVPLSAPGKITPQPPAETSPSINAVGTFHPEDLGPVLMPIRKRYDLPALAAAVIFQGRTVAIGATGERKAGSDVQVTLNDAFHLGSCTKAMTTTVIAMLIEHGQLKWDTTLREVFPEMAGGMQPAYRKVTLKQLLAHRAGLPPPERSWPKGKTFLDMHRLVGSSREQRIAYVRMMLCQPPEAEPGMKYMYSNAGYAIAGAMAERVTDTAWEELMRQMLFVPLGMKTAGFGAMGSPGKIDQPWQHLIEYGSRRPIPPGPTSDNPPVIGPGGAIHCSIGDWAKFIAAHLRGGSDRQKLLQPETFRLLHTPAFGGDYAPGWVVRKRDWGGGEVLTHSGSNTMNYAVVWLAPRHNFAVLAATNQGGKEAGRACDETVGALIKKYLLNGTENTKSNR